jgi:cysteinyl-tRNA synthetase
MSSSVITPSVITRFAPSPTGSLHLGNARTAFFSHLWARRSQGRFILRIEDTDLERSEARHRDQLMSDLRWLGLDWDEGPDVGGPSAPYAQSERGAFYDELFARLQAGGHVYPCYCTAAELELSRKLQRMAGKPPRYAGTCRHLSSMQRAEREARGLAPTLRFAVPADAVIDFTDVVHGPQKYASGDIGDFIIRREDGTSAFFFSNAVDDSVMGVTHVLRGDDHLTNTPRQLMLLDALQLRRPEYGHVGLLVGADGAKLSKRHGSTSVGEFRERGFLSAALLNHLLHLGHTSDVEGWLAPADMPVHFRPEHLGRAPAHFDESQLVHWQKETLQRMSAAEIGGWLGSDQSAAFFEMIRHNVVLPADVLPWYAVLQGELPPFGQQELEVIAAAGPAFFSAAADAFRESGADLSRLTKLLKERTGRKGADLYMPLRVALTGRAHGPELAALLRLMAPGTALGRLESHANSAPRRASPALRIHNSLTGATEEFAPLRANEVRMYVCGITVYDYIHIGHARMLVVFDLVQRYLRSLGFRVTYVRNVTDIDDKIIQRATENGEEWSALARRFTAAMQEDCATLGLEPPDLEPRATDFIGPIIAMTQTLIDKGYAYVAVNGDVMYSVRKFDRYGCLSGKKIDDLRAGSRVQVDDSKLDPLDFVLWKHAKPGEPSWESPWGAGRPGWHIECSAMSTALLGDYFDLHGGGMDLKFPHHENEIAQSCAACDTPFVRLWMHNGFVRINDEKMSKSLGNFFTVRDTLKSLRDPEVLRFFLLGSHYMGPINYSEAQLAQADETLLGLYRALNDAGWSDDPPGAAAWTQFQAAMSDDFNTPEAFAVMQGVARELNTAKAKGRALDAAQSATTLRAMGRVLGLLQQDPAVYLKRAVGQQTFSDAQIEDLLTRRAAARAIKDFAESDRIRDTLSAGGVLIEDKPGGSTGWRRA